MPAASTASATDEQPRGEAGQESPQTRPQPANQKVHLDDGPPPRNHVPQRGTEPPVSAQVWRDGGLTEEAQAALLACALADPTGLPGFWEHGDHLFDLTGYELWHAACLLRRKGKALSLLSIHQKCRSESAKRATRDEDRDEHWKRLDEFVAIIGKVDVPKEMAWVQERCEHYIRRGLHDANLNHYAQLMADPRSSEDDIRQRRAEVIKALKDMDAPPGASNNGQYFTIITMEEIINDDGKPPEWVVENLMPAEGVATISGRAKEGKSWLALDLCLSIASGKHWLEFGTKPGKACYVNLELGKKTFRSRVKSIAAAKKIDLAALKGRFLPLTIDTAKLMAAAVEQKQEAMLASLVLEQVRLGLEKGAMPDPSLIVLDSFYKLTGRLNENDAADVELIYHLIRKLAEDDLHCKVVIIHHFAKGSPGDKMEGERAAGSRVHRQEPNTYVELTPHKVDGALVFHAELRDYPPLPKFCLQFNFPLFKRAPELDPDEINRPSKGGRPPFDPKKLTALLKEKPLTTEEWRKAAEQEFGKSPSTFYRAKDILAEQGLVVQKGKKWLLSEQF